jgi:hypothetical protein
MQRIHTSGKQSFVSPGSAFSSPTMESDLSCVLHYLNFRIAMVYLKRGCNGQGHEDANANAVYAIQVQFGGHKS